MAKQPKHPIIQGYKAIKEINQIIKELASAYVIDRANWLYLQSSNPLGLEKFGILKDTDVGPYTNVLINAAALFEFTKAARVTNLEVAHQTVHVTDIPVDCDVLLDKTHEVSFPLIPYLDQNCPFSIKDIINLQFYKHFFIDDEIMEIVKSLSTSTDDHADMIDTINSKGIIRIEDGSNLAIISKEFFPEIKKAARFDYRFIKRDTLDYVVFYEDLEIMDLYTLAAFLPF